MITRAPKSNTRRETGQVVVIFALLLPVFLALSGVVIGVGNWYVHGKNLQTKADAGAFAGGDAWEFPCESAIDARIDAAARLYAGSNNPQVGGVPDTSIHTVLNGSAWYDDDSNPNPTEFNSPANPSVCASMTLDVKVTEDNSFPLASLIPLFPDIKRKAKVEIQQTEGISGLLPIAVRAPVPVSAAAIFYDESNGSILRVRYLVPNNNIFGLPGGLQGWTTLNSDEPGIWASLTPGARTGVVIATSFRGACNTNLPAGNPASKNITTTPNPCFEDNGPDAVPVFANTISGICNQGSGTQIVNCYYATGTWPNESVQGGLMFVRGYSNSPSAGTGEPELRSVYLDGQSANCGSGFTSRIGVNCTAVLHVNLDLGSQVITPPPGGVETRIPANADVRYRIVSDNAAPFCSFNTNGCALSGSGSTNNTTWTSTNTIPRFDANSLRNSIALRVRLRAPARVGAVNCNASGSNCEWFFTGSVRSAAPPSDTTVLADPVQRYFMGNSSTSSSIQWLQLTTDPACSANPANFRTNGDDNMSVRNDAAVSPSCFLVDVGLKGGIAKDADEQPFLFNDGVGPSQMGSLDCDPAIPQGQILIDGIVLGCGGSGWPIYGKNLFNTSPLCPQQNALFTQPNPGAPWDSSYPWPPLRCIKTRPTGGMNQIERGFKLRFYGNQNQNSCPADAAGYVRGRNYWDQDTNPLNLKDFGYKDDDAPTPRATKFAPNDYRIVTIFLTTTEAFAGSGQNTFPIVGFIEVYVTGFGRVSGNGQVTSDDPCPGSDPPTDLDQSGGSSSGYAVWGHLIKYAIPSPGATPSGVLCDPNSLDPCVSALVE